MKLKKVVLESPLPREVQPTSTTWTEIVPSAQYTSDKADLSYDSVTGLVTIKSKYSVRCVHVSKVLFMEPAESVEARQQAVTIPDIEAPKRRGMPKGGWPKKAPEAADPVPTSGADGQQ